jgi:hypothetical protein
MAMGAAYVAEQQRVATASAAAAAAAVSPAAVVEEPVAAAMPLEPEPEPETARVPAAAEAVPAAASDGVRSRRMLPVGLALVAALVVAAVAIGANMLGGSGGGAVASPTIQPSVAVVVSPSPSIATPSPSPATPSPTATPIPAPTPTPTPSGLFANIKGITVSGGRYVVDYEVFDIVEDNNPHNGRHVHFFYNTVKPVNAGNPGKGPWELYDGPHPFKVYKVSDKPRGATKICILVANKDHSVIQKTGNCVAIPT